MLLIGRMIGETILEGKMGNRGTSLIELITVVSVISIVLVISVFSYKDWMGKYKVEKATRELYSDMMTARACAVQNNTIHFAVLNNNSYSIVEDTDDSGDINTGDKVLASFPKAVEYTLCRNNTGNKVCFGKRGLVSPNRTIWFSTSLDPDYDCMKISKTRIIMGQYKNNECEPK
jgi:Tfp pilus assembly protein FimT